MPIGQAIADIEKFAFEQWKNYARKDGGFPAGDLDLIFAAVVGAVAERIAASDESEIRLMDAEQETLDALQEVMDQRGACFARTAGILRIIDAESVDDDDEEESEE